MQPAPLPPLSAQPSPQRKPRLSSRLSYRWLSLYIVAGLVLGSGLGLLLTSRAAQQSGSGPHTPQQPVSGLAFLSPTSAPSPTSTTSPITQQPLPVHHFAFGVSNAPGAVSYLNDMRSNNGAAFDYRYQYLSAGVNTGNGWETWNSPAGAFATYYIQDSVKNNYLPAFVYYDMLQSNGSCGNCGEQQKDLSNLANPAVMKAYYANWALLMQKIGAAGQQTLVIVEPDLWGFMEQSVAGGTNSAASVPASVASSGYADVAGLPDNAQGFAWALLHLRDRYAPNALLALHASSWATNIDIGSNTDSGLNVAGVARKEANFLLSAGIQGNPDNISHWDVISNDVADRDSGQSGTWWDPTNAKLPNFSRYLQFISALTADTGLRVMMWQVPIGNQYFDTENNSSGHQQDNRAQYILSHVADFAHAGIIGVLFGAGNGGTSYDDTRKDGITNPAPISTFQCNQCNSHQSQYPDDDGGYLRIFVGQYYQSGGYGLP